MYTLPDVPELADPGPVIVDRTFEINNFSRLWRHSIGAPRPHRHFFPTHLIYRYELWTRKRDQEKPIFFDSSADPEVFLFCRGSLFDKSEDNVPAAISAMTTLAFRFRHKIRTPRSRRRYNPLPVMCN